MQRQQHDKGLNTHNWSPPCRSCDQNHHLQQLKKPSTFESEDVIDRILNLRSKERQRTHPASRHMWPTNAQRCLADAIVTSSSSMACAVHCYDDWFLFTFGTFLTFGSLQSHLRPRAGALTSKCCLFSHVSNLVLTPCSSDHTEGSDGASIRPRQSKCLRSSFPRRQKLMDLSVPTFVHVEYCSRAA